MVFVEGAPVFVHEGVLFPGFGNHQHHGVGQRVAAHDEQLEGVVEGGRVRLAGVMERPHLLQVGAEDGRGNRLLRALNQFTLPRRVLISPLWAIMRKGWADPRSGRYWSRSAGAPGPGRTVRLSWRSR